jgi:plasmid replication initiation protein
LLLPERHPVRDFFVLDVLDVVPRSDMASMEHPIFSLSTKPDMRVLKYAHGDNAIEIIPSGVGLPTVFDKDILIYCISHLMHRKNSGQVVGPHVRLTTHDLLVNTNRPTNNLGYARLSPALDRLRGTVFKTTIKTGEQTTTRGFGLIDEYEYNRKGMFADRLRYMEVKLSDWLFRAVNAAEVLPISRDYFRLRSPLDRRLYELARKHCGTEQKLWRIGLDKLQLKTGSKQERKHFAAHMRLTVKENHLPDYGVNLEGQSDNIVFYRRGMLKRPKVDGLTADSLDWCVAGEVLERAKQEARARNRDFQALKHEFIGFMSSKGRPENLSGAFLGFVRSKSKL